MDFRNVILIMTSNAGAAEQARAPTGFAREVRTGEDSEAVKRLFTPEFRNRLDAIVPFAALSPDVMAQVVDKFIVQLENQLTEKAVAITLSPAARAHLARVGYDPAMGARPLARVIQDKVKKPLADALLFGSLQAGGSVVIDVAPKEEGDALTFAYTGTPPKGNKTAPKSSRGARKATEKA